MSTHINVLLFQKAEYIKFLRDLVCKTGELAGLLRRDLLSFLKVKCVA